MADTVTTKCECTGAGWCARHKMHKSAHFVRLCQTKESYFRAWEEGRGPGQPRDGSQRVQHEQATAGGPGTELSQILAWFGLHAKTGCQCKDRARTMDRNGPDWCETNLPTILGWLKQEAKTRGLPFSALLVKPLVLLAIRRSCAKAVQLAADNRQIHQPEQTERQTAAGQ